MSAPASNAPPVGVRLHVPRPRDRKWKLLGTFPDLDAAWAAARDITGDHLALWFEDVFVSGPDLFTAIPAAPDANTRV